MRLFKNYLVYQFDDEINYSAEELNQLLGEKPLQECMAQELESFGWLPAFSQGANYVESVNNAYFFRLGIERKKLPRLAIRTAVEKRARELEINIETRSRYKEVEEMIINELMKNAFPEQSSMLAYIDREKGWLVVDATSVKRASELTSLLRKTLGTLPVVGFAPQVFMPTVMTHWVKEGIPSNNFTFLDEVEMKELQKEEGGVARYRGIPLDSREILQNLDEGWEVTRLGLIYNEAVSFSLGEDFIVKRMRYLDTFHEELDESEDPNAIAAANGYLQVANFRALMSELYNLCHE